MTFVATEKAKDVKSDKDYRTTHEEVLLRKNEEAATRIANYTFRNLKLVTAAQNGDEAELKRLMALGADVNAPMSIGANTSCALIQAAQNGHASVVQTLVGSKANIDATRNDGTTALHIAVRNNHVQTASTLIELKASLSLQDADGKCSANYATTQVMKELFQ